MANKKQTAKKVVKEEEVIQEVVTSVEETKPQEKVVSTKSEPAKPEWEIKDRMYYLIGRYTPLTYTIPGKHTRKHPLLYFDPIKKEQKDLVAMEAGLTSKEFEESKRNSPKESKKSIQIKLQNLWDDDETSVPSKEDRAEWRKFQKDKTRSKRDRRKNIPFSENI